LARGASKYSCYRTAIGGSKDVFRPKRFDVSEEVWGACGKIFSVSVPSVGVVVREKYGIKMAGTFEPLSDAPQAGE